MTWTTSQYRQRQIPRQRKRILRYHEYGYLIHLLYLITSVRIISSDLLTLASPDAQLILRHAVLSSVTLKFSSMDALVHFLMVQIYCILEPPPPPSSPRHYIMIAS